MYFVDSISITEDKIYSLSSGSNKKRTARLIRVLIILKSSP